MTKVKVENYGNARYYYIRYSCAVLMGVRVENAHITSILVTVVNTDFDVNSVKFASLKEARTFAEVVSKGVTK